MTKVDIWQTVFDGLTAVAAIVALWFARSGLSTWKRQLKGTAEFELAQSLLIKSYEMRDDINRIRNVPLLGERIPRDDPEVQGLSPSEISYLAIERALESRWERFVERSRDLDPLLIQAESLWGSASKKKIRDLRELALFLRYMISNYLHSVDPRNPHNQKRSDREWNKNKSQKTVFDSSKPGKPDDFSQELNSAIIAIEDELRPYLKR